MDDRKLTVRSFLALQNLDMASMNDGRSTRSKNSFEASVDSEPRSLSDIVSGYPLSQSHSYRLPQLHWDGVSDLFVPGGFRSHELPVVGEALDAGIFLDGQGAVSVGVAEARGLLCRAADEGGGGAVPSQTSEESCSASFRLEGSPYGFLLDFVGQVAPVLSFLEEAQVLHLGLGVGGAFSRIVPQVPDGVLEGLPFGEFGNFLEEVELLHQGVGRRQSGGEG